MCVVCKLVLFLVSPDNFSGGSVYVGVSFVGHLTGKVCLILMLFRGACYQASRCLLVL